MKKPALKNLIVITGLLILCVMTLTAIYATTPESSVLLLEETFAHLDKNKWRHEVAECTEDGSQFHLMAAEGLAADGILRVLPNLTSPEFRIKRETPSKCNACADSSLFSARLETKNLFNASSGLMEVRAKFRKVDWLRLRISVVSNDSEAEDFRNSAETAMAKGNDFPQVEITFESAINRTVLNRITLSTDHQKVDEKTFDLYHQQGNSSNASAPVTQPFYLIVKVDFGEKSLENSGTHSGGESLAERRSQEKLITSGLVNSVKTFDVNSEAVWESIGGVFKGQNNAISVISGRGRRKGKNGNAAEHYLEGALFIRKDSVVDEGPDGI